MTILQQYMKDKFMMQKMLRRISKHQASKKGYKHNHGLSHGQRKDQQKLDSMFENVKLA